ncbi:MAG: hypothetical protein FJW94_06690 [Actinobacteria bacterium]|nr:hypothetical protein [Actinomycetota bacterium]
MLGALRLIDTDFHLGTWSDQLYTGTADDKRAAKVALVTANVSSATNGVADNWNRWGIKATAYAGGAAAISANQNNPGI